MARGNGRRRAAELRPAMALRRNGVGAAVGEGERRQREMGVPGGVERRPDRVMPVGAGRPRPRCRRTTATWPAPGGEGRACPRTGKGRGKRAARAEREAAGPAAPAPFSLFF